MKRFYAWLRAKWLAYKYRNRPYSEYYAHLMNTRAKVDPMKAVGGRWDEIGPLQLEYLKSHGLMPSSKLLDFGCGSLRGGIHFIGYLDPKGYTGVDISEDLITFAHQLIREQQLEAKKAELLLSHDLTLSYLGNRKFDFILATSVLTHMVWPDIEKLLINMPRIMHPQSVFYATFLINEGDRSTTSDFQNFYYSFDQFKALEDKLELNVEWPKDFNHPRGQQMLKFTRK